MSLLDIWRYWDENDTFASIAMILTLLAGRNIFLPLNFVSLGKTRYGSDRLWRRSVNVAQRTLIPHVLMRN